MAVTKTLIRAVPYERNSEVERWELEMKYENDSEGDATYYTSTFSVAMNSTDNNDVIVFTEKAAADWTRAELEALCPSSHWDVVFASQVDSVITNPVVNPVINESYTMPS
jgi:hypothetical protein